MNETVVLAYSGEVDTTICVHWLQGQGFKVIPVLVQLGQPYYLEPAGEKALGIGATTVHISDLRNRFIKDFIWPTLKAQARYESGYFLSAALNRPLIAEELVRIASEENCSVIAHGARSVGNEHIRFENSISALAPDMKIVAPLKELGLKSVKDDLEYARKYHLPVERVKHTVYNIEENLWGVNIQLGPLDSSPGEPDYDTYIMTTPLPETPDKPTIVEIGFESGEPVTLDGKKIEPLELINLLNKIGGRNAVGRVEMIENKISGEKACEIYENPAAVILYAAHQSLENTILDKELLHFKTALSQKYAELVYNGYWFSPLRQALSQFFDDIQQPVSGLIKIKLYRGNLSIIERRCYPSLLRSYGIAKDSR